MYCFRCHVFLPNIKICAMLLLCLFVYDIFWVFFSERLKIMFPRNLLCGVSASDFMMLGLGDMVQIKTLIIIFWDWFLPMSTYCRKCCFCDCQIWTLFDLKSFTNTYGMHFLGTLAYWLGVCSSCRFLDPLTSASSTLSGTCFSNRIFVDWNISTQCLCSKRSLLFL